MAISEKELLQTIIASMKEAGYDPHDQLYGYYMSGDESYITRRGNARELIKSVGRNTIGDFLRTSKKHFALRGIDDEES